MVEGPGCKIKGQKIKNKLLGKKVLNVLNKLKVKSMGISKRNGSSNTVTPIVTKYDFHLLKGRILNNVLTLGKELFMFFDNICLRVHFLMAGSFRINNKAVDSDASRLTKDDQSVLDIQFDTDTLSFYKSAAELRESTICIEKYELLETLDICSSIFEGKRALNLVMQQKGRQLCDILLDQEILPGVGNIIKNEALFDSFLNPNSFVENLTENQLSYLIKMTRDFSMLFYKCRSTGENLSKYYKVYSKGTCGQCKSKIVCTRMGDDNNRMTYFCQICQDNDPKRQHKPMKNSLLGWVIDPKSSAIDHIESWSCIHCTLINKSTVKVCDACGFLQDVKPTNCLKRKAVSSESEIKVQPDKKICFNKSDNCSKVVSVSKKESKIPNCPGHNVKCSLREVRKTGPNKGRMFFTCSLGRGKECKFFKWADEDFPRCIDHNKPCVLRTVLKQGSNNGRKFFACAKAKKDQCKYFEWTESYE